MKKIHSKHYLSSMIRILLFAFTLLGCQQNSSDNSPNETDAVVEETPSGTEEGEVEEDEPSDGKPEVAEIKENNEPNRMVTSFNGDTRTQMGFNWYTTDLFRSEEHTSELQSRFDLVCRLLLEQKKRKELVCN